MTSKTEDNRFPQPKNHILGIRFQFVAMFTLLMFSLMFINGFLALEQQRDLLIKERKLRGMAVLQSWASICRERLVANDLSIELTMYDLMSEMTRDSIIVAPFLQASDGRVVIHDEESRAGSFLSDSTSQKILNEREPGLILSADARKKVSIFRVYFDILFRGKSHLTYYDLYAPILVKDKFLGTARIGLTDRGIDSDLRAGAIRMLVGFLGVFGIGMVIIMVMVYRITGPLKLLVKGAFQIGMHNDLDYKIEFSSHNELGDLRDAFNEMTTNLKNAQSALIQQQQIESKLKEDLVYKRIHELELKEKMQLEQERSLKFRRQATIDALTGLYNKRQFDEDIQGFLRRAEAERTPLTALFLDMDNFKYLNDTLGHQAGDEALKHLSVSINTSIRGTDRAYRVGGDEFVIMFGSANQQVALGKAIAIQNKYDEIKSPDNKTSISYGMVEHIPGESATDLYHRADAAMFEAKKGKKR